MQQKAVRDAAQLFDRLVVAIDDRRVGEIGARHDEHVDILAEEQDVQRRIGQHHADIIVFAQMRERAPRALFQQHDRAAEARQQRLFRFGYLADFSRAVHVPAHDRKGLFVALLAPPQRPRDFGIVAAAG